MGQTSFTREGNLEIILRSRERWIQKLERLVLLYVDPLTVADKDHPAVQHAASRAATREDNNKKLRERRKRRRIGACPQRGKRPPVPKLSFKPIHTLPQHWKG